MCHKWNRLVAGMSLAALLLSGCGKDPQPAAAPTEPPTAPTLATQPSQPQVTEPPITEPPVTEPPVTEPPVAMADPVTKLSCTKWRTYPELVDLGGGLVLATRNQFSTDHQKVVCTVEILDLINDTVAAETLLMHTAEPVPQRFADGSVVLAVPSDSTLRVYDSQLQLLQTLEANSVDGFFSADRKNYYYAESGMLYRMDVDSGNCGAMALQSELRLESLVGVHPTQGLLVARVYLSCYSSNCGLAVINPTTGAVKLLTDRLDALQIYGDRFCGMCYDDTIYGYDVYAGSLSDGTVALFDASELAEYEVGYTLVPGSSYLIRKKYTQGAENVWLYDLASGGTMCALEDYGMTAPINGAIYLSGPQLIVGFYEDGLDFYPVLLDPKGMSFEAALTEEDGQWDALIDEGIIEKIETELAGPELPGTLAEVREQADALEKTYGVTILLGQQTAATTAHTDFKATVHEEPAAISAALSTLEAELAKYPAGFLKQFRNSVLEGGLYFCLTGAIDGGIDTAGFARLSGDRYNLVLDITASDLAGTLHHELWHAIEMRISTDAFNTSQWTACNPSGFAYYGKYDAGYADLTRWTYTSGSGRDSYFVDPYARIDGREDRARIWEYVMTGKAGDLLAAPAIEAKLEIMDTLLRQRFDSSRWSEVYWD